MYPPAPSLPPSFLSFFGRCLFDMSHFAIFTVNHLEKVDYGLRSLTISEGLLWSKRETIGPSVFPSSPLRNSFSLIVTLTIRVDHCNFFSPRFECCREGPSSLMMMKPFSTCCVASYGLGRLTLLGQRLLKNGRRRDAGDFISQRRCLLKASSFFLEKKKTGEGSRNVGRSCVVAVFLSAALKSSGWKIKGNENSILFLVGPNCRFF